MSELWAIDPGGYDSKAKSTALVVFDLAMKTPIRYTCMRGQDLFRLLMNEQYRPDVVYEGYHTFPGMGGNMTMNEHKTAETCGLIRAVCDYRNLKHTKQWSSIKNHALRWIESRGTVLAGTNQHLRDAELHGWWFIRNLGGSD